MAIARTWIAGSREVESHAPQLNIAGYDVIFFIARVLPSRFWWASEPIVFYYIDVGYDPKWAKFSIGSVLQWEVMEDLYRKGNTPTIFDFSTGYGSHKSRFGKEAREEVNVLLLPATVANRILAAAWRGVNTISDTAVRTLDGLGMKQSLKKAIRGLGVGSK